MNAEAIKSAEAPDEINLNRCGNMPLSDKRSILQLNDGFTNGYGQAVAKASCAFRAMSQLDQALA